jgi:hypothetical protein
MSEGFFRSTIHIMIAVAKDSEYLMRYEKMQLKIVTKKKKLAYHVKMYWT